MKYYIFVQDNKLNGAGNCPQMTEGVTNLEVTQAVYDAYCAEPEKYIYDGTGIADNPNYEKEQEEKRKTERRAELIAELDTLDLKSLRALRAIQAGVGTEADENKISELEEQAEQIRQELKEL